MNDRKRERSDQIDLTKSYLKDLNRDIALQLENTEQQLKELEELSKALREQSKTLKKSCKK